MLPKSLADEVSACREIGEYETGLSLLVAGLVDHDAHVGESLRIGILLLAEEWAVRGRVWDGLRRCRIVPESEAPLTLVDRPDAVPSGAGLFHVPWIRCGLCGETLARAHRREEWGELSDFADHYVLSGRGAPRVFAADALWQAVRELRHADS